MLAVVQRATWFSTGMMRVDEKRFGPQPNPESCHSGFFVFISGGARRQQMDVDVGHFKGAEGGSNDYAVSLYNLGTIYDFKNGHQVWINYGEGFDLLDPAKFYVWRYADSDWDAQAALYYIWSDKVITTDSATHTVSWSMAY
jgi:iron complex outermembrane receptor protein